MPLIQAGWIEDLRDDAFSHVLQTLDPVPFHRLDTDYAYLFVVLLQPLANAHKGTCSAHACNKVRDRPFGLHNDLAARRFIMSVYICRVVELVRHEIEVRLLGHYPVGKSDRPVSAFIGRA